MKYLTGSVPPLTEEGMKTAFITGANRGIGLEIVKQLIRRYHFDRVFLGCRDLGKLKTVLNDEMCSWAEKLFPIQVDVGDYDSVAKAYTSYLEIVGSGDHTLTLFINNAAVNLDWQYGGFKTKSLDIDPQTLERIFRINAFGTLYTIQIFNPSFKAGTRVVNVCSGSAELARDELAFTDFQIGYASSKAAQLMITKKLAAALFKRGVCINAVCPGSVRTDMGGLAVNKRTLEIGATGVILSAFLDRNNPPTGSFFRDGKRIPTDFYSKDFDGTKY